MTLVVSSFPAGVTIANPSGPDASGLPYVMIDASAAALLPGQLGIPFVLRINNPQRKSFVPALIMWTELGPQVPPDPGAAGLVSLVGIDADGEEIRDNVQRFIVGIPEAPWDADRVVPT